MKEPVITLQLPLSSINAVLNALGQNGAIVSSTQQAIQQQAQQQMNPPPAPPAEGLTQIATPDPQPAKKADNVVPIGGDRA